MRIRLRRNAVVTKLDRRRERSRRRWHERELVLCALAGGNPRWAPQFWPPGRRNGERRNWQGHSYVWLAQHVGSFHWGDGRPFNGWSWSDAP